MLEKFEHSPDILAIFHGKNVDKTFFCCIPTDQESAQSDYKLQQCLEHSLLSRTKKNFTDTLFIVYYEGKMNWDYFSPFFPKPRVRIKDNNSPHGKFHRLSFPFPSKFPDLNFAPYVLST